MLDFRLTSWNQIMWGIVILTVGSFLFTWSLTTLLVGIATYYLTMWVAYKYTADKDTDKSKEGFTGGEQTGQDSNVVENSSSESAAKDVELDAALAAEFNAGSKYNPLSNLMIAEIADNPERKAAPPAFNSRVNADINRNVKRAIQMMNPNIHNINKQLHGDLWGKFQFDTFMRAFYTMPNTQVVNDQGAFGQFLYNNLKFTGKENTPEGAITRANHNDRWIMM